MRNISKKLCKLDLFSSPVLMRYNKNEVVSSRTGGCFSLLIIIILVVAFYNSWMDMLNKTSVKSESEVTQEPDPSATIISS